MSEWENPIKNIWVTPKKEMFDTLCKEIYTLGYNAGMRDAEREISDE